MPTIKILDELNSPLLDVESSKASGLGRYLPDEIVKLRALRPVAASLLKPLAESATNPVVLELAPPDPIPLGGGDLSLDAGVRAAIGVHQSDELLFPADDLRDAVSVPGGTAYVSLGLAPRVKAQAEGAHGALGFGFAAGASLSLRYFQPFDIAATSPTLGAALGETLKQAVVPADVDDLAALPVGAHASIGGEGELQLSGSVELATVTNPLATPSLPVIGSASISAGASVTVAGEWRASGAFEIRVSKTGASQVRLSYYKRAGSEVTIDATAALGISARIGDSDIIKRLLAAISSDPEADLVQLIEAGLDDEQVMALQEAVKRSVDRSLRLSTELQFSSVRRGEALFAYELDLARLTPAARSATADALGGRLTAINRLAAGEDPSVRAVGSGILQERARRITWRINLFGIVNVRSISELLRNGSLSYDAVDGTLNAADSISSQKILAVGKPFESDGNKVRKLVFESMIVTAAYHASRVTSGVALRCSASYFEARPKTPAAVLREDYNAVIGLGLTDAAERDRRIGFEHSFGPSTFLVECVFDQRAADSLFIGSEGGNPGPLSREFYERAGRDALLALIPADDAERAHRRAVVEDPAAWAALVDAGPAAARPGLVRELGDVRAAHVISDYLVIRWWADAMADAAGALMAMRQFLGGRTAESLATDPEFKKKRSKLEKELAGVVKESRAQFGDPWGMLALDFASRGASAVHATIVSPKLTATYAERIAMPVRGAVRSMVAGRAPLAAASRAAEPRPFTADERELLRRHAINLRLGAFSNDGEFQTDEADVRRLFTELLPAEIAERKAAGQKLRLLFYAHGGLIGERKGLEPVLARLKFWRHNNVYPVSFVWETGLRETITDILRGLTGTRDVAARGLGEDLADAVIEVAARQGGKRVWSQMKRSAEVAVMEGGGAAMIAALTRDFWNTHHADVEIHAAGHSAGAIFQAQFLPVLVGQKPAANVPPISVRTLHFLAPACTSGLFTARLKDLIGPDKRIGAMTMYTMTKTLEQADKAGPYNKSLLYLVSRAFEDQQPTPILGLEESLRQDVQLIRFFGLAGTQKQADLLFSKTPPNAGLRDRSMSTSHGGFDDDPSTMNSLMRRVLDVNDDMAITDFFQEELAAAPGQERSVEEVVASSIATAEDARAGAAAVPGSKSPAAPATPGAPAILGAATGGARRALCVGIDKYGPPYDLAGCVNDAKSWAQALKALKFDVTPLHDRKASRAAILDAFGSLVTAAKPGDVVVFQFAGHGTQVDDLDGDESDSLDEAFCPADFADGALLIDDDIRAVVASLQAGVNLTCFIDCCHSGTITRALVPAGRPARAPEGSRARYIPYSRAISESHRQFRAGSGSRAPAAGIVSEAAIKEVCFSACQPHEVAFETGGAGEFTTRATGLLATATDLTHAVFVERVISAFGPNPRQTPYLDCAPPAKKRRLLQPLAEVMPSA